ncbi:MAG: VOC family protein [Caldilineaceae bacterium]|nr:VOC family protein [Caldilineaceae bacterium]
MADERTYPCLPCRDIEEAIAFYVALGFTRTYRQLKPNPYAVVALEEIQIHLFGMDHFDPAHSYGNVIVVVPDPDELYQRFATGLRAAYGKLPVAGIPRLLRPRKKYGTVHGFSVVDVGGNWLRVSKLGDREPEEKEEKTTGLARMIDVAARLGDAHGDEGKALKTLENGLKRYPNAPRLEQARAWLYRAELAVRVHDPALAQASLAAVYALALTGEEQATLAEELAQSTELVLAGESG